MKNKLCGETLCCFVISYLQRERNWTVPSNSNFLFPITLQPDVIESQTMNSARSKIQSFKYQKYTPPGCKNKGLWVWDKFSVPLSATVNENSVAFYYQDF